MSTILEATVVSHEPDTRVPRVVRLSFDPGMGVPEVNERVIVGTEDALRARYGLMPEAQAVIEEARKALEATKLAMRGQPHDQSDALVHLWDKVDDLEHSLAPKRRWTARNVGDCWTVNGPNGLLCDLHETQARAVADALEALEPKER
jgi:hypothetical protein